MPTKSVLKFPNFMYLTYLGEQKYNFDQPQQLSG